MIFSTQDDPYTILTIFLLGKPCPCPALKIDFWGDIMPINLWVIPLRPMGAIPPQTYGLGQGARPILTDSTQVTQAFFGGRCVFESLLEDGLDRFGHIKFFSEFTYDKNCFKCLAVCLRNYCTSLKSQVISLLLFFLSSKVIYI